MILAKSPCVKKKMGGKIPSLKKSYSFSLCNPWDTHGFSKKFGPAVWPAIANK